MLDKTSRRKHGDSVLDYSPRLHLSPTIHYESRWINNTFETKTLNYISIACKGITFSVLREVALEKSHLVNQSACNKMRARVREKQRMFL